MAEAYQQSGDTSLGPNFDVTAWCDSWLNSNGANTLEPVVEIENGQIKSLKVK